MISIFLVYVLTRSVFTNPAPQVPEFVLNCLFYQGEDVILDFGLVRCGWCFFFFQAEDGIRDIGVTGVQTCALPISTKCVLTKPWECKRQPLCIGRQRETIRRGCRNRNTQRPCWCAACAGRVFFVGKSTMCS